MIVETHGEYPAELIVKKLGIDPAFSGFVGLLRLGFSRVGLVVPLDPKFGIYQRRRGKKGQINVLEKFYRPTNPRTVPQQAQRAKMTAAVAAWQSLTGSQQKEYDVKAKGKQMSGFNLFLREYLNSH